MRKAALLPKSVETGEEKLLNSKKEVAMTTSFLLLNYFSKFFCAVDSISLILLSWFTSLAPGS